MQAAIAGLTAKPPFTNQLEHAQRQAQRQAQLGELVAHIRTAPQQNTRSAYESALRKSPEDFYLHDNFARYLVGSQEYALAAEHKKWVLDRFPRDVETIIALARIRMQLGQFDESLTLYRTALATSLDQAEIHQEIGELFIRQSRFQEAVSELEQAVRLKPDLIPAINALGVAKLNLRDLAGAGREFQRILEQQPDLTAHINLASVLYQQGQRDAAIEHLNIALTLTDDQQIASEIRRGIASYQK
jgi:tetratricopeptide (TPR) repeat protein